MKTNESKFRGVAESELIPMSGLVGQYGKYIADPDLVHAANTALCLELPLLLTGDPGSGKSDFAWVAAKALKHAKPLRCFIRSDTKARDLLYHYDALVRFGEAQHGGNLERVRDPRHYISLRPLGAALMHPGPQRAVVLLDEIDKAPRDLPNDLLHELDEMDFEIPEIGDFDTTNDHHDRIHKGIPLRRDMVRPKNVKRPLVIVTSNAERQLPDPFLRRCVFYRIPKASKDKLKQIAEARFDPTQRSLIDKLVTVYHALRDAAGLQKSPTTAEMLEWVKAITRYHADDVTNTINDLAKSIEENQGVDWSRLPSWSLLVKLNEDLETLGIGVDAG